MRHVFSNTAECIHVFAQRTQGDGRCGNVFFEGDTLYSYGYHYPLAQFRNDGQYVVINDKGYSVSTSRHIGIARGALSHYKVFRTTDIELEYVHRHIMALRDKLSKARKPELYIGQILGSWQRLNKYLDYTKTTGIKSRQEYRQIKKFVKSIEADDWQEKLAEVAKKRRKQDQKALRIALAEFESYESDRFRHGNTDYLRLSQDGEHVESSQGVRVKRENALVLYRMIERGIDIKGKHIEHYTVTSINGTLKIGCHNISMKSVHKVGAQL